MVCCKGGQRYRQQESYDQEARAIPDQKLYGCVYRQDPRPPLFYQLHPGALQVALLGLD